MTVYRQTNFTTVGFVYQASTAEVGAEARCFSGKEGTAFERLWIAADEGWFGL